MGLRQCIAMAFVFVGILAVVDPVRAQCSVHIVAEPPALVCGPGSVILTATGDASSVLLADDFDTGTVSAGWSASPAARFDDPCGPGDGTPYLWMGSSATAPRVLQTYPVNVACGGDICFDFRMAVQGDPEPCEGPDGPNEGVSLAYSTDGGGSFSPLNYFNPGSGSNPNLTAWNRYCFNIPGVAQTSSTIFAWVQQTASGPRYDHWGLDNVEILRAPCGSTFVYDWDHLAGSPDPQTVVEPLSDTTTFQVTYTDGTDTCSDSVTVSVTPPGLPSVTTGSTRCFDTCDGTALVEILSGAPGVGWSWLDEDRSPLGITTALATGLCAGDVTVEVTDQNGCPLSGSGTVGEPPPVELGAPSIVSPSCLGACDGQITLDASGASQYSLDDGQTFGTSPVFVGLCAGTYGAVVDNGRGCPEPLTIRLPESTVPCGLDAGVDAGLDSGLDPDGGSGPDAAAEGDAAPAPDSGPPTFQGGGGCGCHTPPTAPDAGFALLVVGVLVAWRRRRS